VQQILGNQLVVQLNLVPAMLLGVVERLIREAQ
ncbi:MAG: hypothetical protein JWM30_1789, partial [Burkholderia sp.]|nr:hypothetical protein [Burkholderia sp.]